MAEEIRFKLIVDTANGTAVIASLQKQLEDLKKKLAEVKTTASPAVPANAFDGIKNPPINSIDALRKKLSELKTSLSSAEIGSDAFKQLSIAVQETQTQLVAADQAAKGLDVAPAAGSVNELKQRVSDLKTELSGVRIGSDEFKKLQREIFTANSELRQINKEMKGLTNAQGLRATGKLAEGLVASFELARHAVEIFGASSENSEAIQKKMAAAQEVLVAVLTTRKIIEAAIESRVAASFLIDKGRIAVTYALGAAQSVLNAIMSANPIALIVLAVAGLITGMIALKDKVAIVGEAFRIVTIPIKLLLDGLEAIGKAIGIIGDENHEKAIKNIGLVSEFIQKRYKDEIDIAKASNKETYKLEQEKIKYAKLAAEAQLKEIEAVYMKEGKLSADQKKEKEKLKDELQNANKEGIILEIDHQKQIRAEDKKTQELKLGALKDGYAKDVALSKNATAQKIEDIKNSAISEQAKQEQIASITKEGQNALAKLSNDFGRKQLDAEKNIAILSAEEGTKARLDAEIKGIERERDYRISHETLTSKEIEVIRLQSQKDIHDKTIAFDKKSIEEANTASINSTVENTQSRLDAELTAAGKLRDFRLANEAHTENERLNIISEYNTKAVALKDKFIQSEAQREQSRVAVAIGTENAIGQAQLLRLQEEINNTGTTEERRLTLIAQYAEIEKSLAADQGRADLDDLKSKYDEETKTRKQNHDAHLITDAEFAAQQKAADDSYDAQKLLKKQQTADKEVKIAAGANKQILDEKTKTFQKQIQFEQGLSNALDGIKQIEIANAGNNEKKKKEIAKRYAAFELALGLASIASSTAEAVAKSVAEFPLTVGQPWAGLALVNGAVQAGVLVAQKAAVLALATGGLVDGDGTETSDSIPARLSKGESVINARSTKMYKPLLSAINQAGGGVAFDFSPGLASGGIATSSTSDMRADIVDAIHAAMATAPATKVYVTETDITRAQQRVSVIESRATLG